MPTVYEGSCLCGAVRFQVHGELGQIVCCHCSQCRKAQGGAFAVNAPVATDSFTFVSGEEHLRAYESSPGKHRCFCGRCGSPVYSKRVDRPEVVRVRIGLLDTKIPQRPSKHIYFASKAEWIDVCDDLPRHNEREQGR